MPIYKVQFGGGANYLLETDTRTAPVHADRKATLFESTLALGRPWERDNCDDDRLRISLVLTIEDFNVSSRSRSDD